MFSVDIVEASLAKSGKGSKGPVDDLSAYRKAPVIVRARTPNVHAENKVRDDCDDMMTMVVSDRRLLSPHTNSKDMDAVCESDAFLATVFLQARHMTTTPPINAPAMLTLFCRRCCVGVQLSCACSWAKKGGVCHGVSFYCT
jgi:hypothetical protein